jgi:hypothetical protein
MISMKYEGLKRRLNEVNRVSKSQPNKGGLYKIWLMQDISILLKREDNSDQENIFLNKLEMKLNSN